MSDFVGQPWPRRRQHQRSGERRDARRASRSGRWGPCERAQARPGARRAAACPRAAAPGRAPGGPPTTTGCCGGPGCSDRGAAPAAGPGPPGVGATPTPDPTGPATPTSSPDALGFQGPGILFFFFYTWDPLIRSLVVARYCVRLIPITPASPSSSTLMGKLRLKCNSVCHGQRKGRLRSRILFLLPLRSHFLLHCASVYSAAGQ